MAGKQAEGASHLDMWGVNPEVLKIVTDKGSPFYDERVEKPVPEWLVASIVRHGVLEPVIVVRDGADFVVDDGRQRVRACIEANKKLAAAGKPLRQVGYVIKRPAEGDAGIIGLSAAANLRVGDSPTMRARKAQRMLEAGADEETVALDFGVSRQAVRDWLALLDCATDVQKAVDAGQISERVARVELATLPRDKQVDALKQMLEVGATRGAAASKAVRAVKRGERVKAPAPKRTRMRNQAEIEKVVEALDARADDLKPDGAGALRALRWVLREDCDQCDDLAEVLAEKADAACASR